MAGMDYSGSTFRNWKHVNWRYIEDAKGLTSAEEVRGLRAYKRWLGTDLFYKNGSDSVSGGALLGDSPLYLSLSRTMSVRVILVSKGAFYEQVGVGALEKLDGDSDTHEFHGTIGGYAIDYIREDNGSVVQYARLTEPNGNVWAGFSGYLIGDGYGEYKAEKYRGLRCAFFGELDAKTQFSSEYRTEVSTKRLFELFKGK